MQNAQRWSGLVIQDDICDMIGITAYAGRVISCSRMCHVSLQNASFFVFF